MRYCLILSAFVFIGTHPWKSRSSIDLVTVTTFLMSSRDLIVFGVLMFVNHHNDKKNKEGYGSNYQYPDHVDCNLRFNFENPSGYAIVRYYMESIF